MTNQRDKDLDIHGPGVPVGAQELILGGSKRAPESIPVGASSIWNDLVGRNQQAKVR